MKFHNTSNTGMTFAELDILWLVRENPLLARQLSSIAAIQKENGNSGKMTVTVSFESKYDNAETSGCAKQALNFRKH